MSNRPTQAHSRTDGRGVVIVRNISAYRATHPDAVIATCGTCGWSWDDAVATSWTPAPSGRCPFEANHIGKRDPRPLPPKVAAQVGKQATQATPGPYTVALPKTGEDVTLVARTAVHGNPVHVARVYGPGILSHETGVRDANARLLAAAPELRDALERVATWLVAPALDAKTLAEVAAIVREALTKARAL